MSKSLIKLEKVWKIYQLGKMQLPVLRGVSMDIVPGSFVSIMGPSGSGKSTLLHLVGCLDIPTHGKVLLGGQDISELSEDELSLVRGEKIGFVFQQFNLLPNLNAIENVTIPMVFRGVPEKERIERATKLLTSIGMKDRLLHKPFELSGGEQQRIAIARSLANNPEMVLADEPTGNLDTKTGAMIMKILVDLHKKEGKTIVVITHDQNIADHSEEIVRIRDGEIVG